jgi:hypothetical protein
MLTRSLGKNGQTSSAIGVGCMGMSDFYGPSDRSEGISAGPRAAYRRDWLIVWPLESARAHDGLTELGNADLTDTQIRALRGFDLSFSTFGKTMPFFGNILPTLRSYSGIE